MNRTRYSAFRHACFRVFGAVLLLVPRAVCRADTLPLADLLPPQSGERMRWETGPVRYSPDNLFEYIDGSADHYLAYGFRALISLGLADARDRTITVDIYEMRSLLDAFGVYSTFRRPDAEYAPIGAEAMIVEYGLRFYQGPYEIELTSSDTGNAVRDAMLETARGISARIPHPPHAPPVLTLLPRTGRIERSARYIPAGVLGYSFFPRGLDAQYLIDADTVKAFIVLCDSDSSALSAMQQFSTHVKKQGGVLRNKKARGMPVLVGDVPYHRIGIAAVAGRYVFGAVDCPSSKAANRVALLFGNHCASSPQR